LSQEHSQPVLLAAFPASTPERQLFALGPGRHWLSA